MNASSQAKATVVIPNWNGARWLPGCLGGLAEQTFRDFHVVVVDGASHDGSVAYVRETFPAVHVLTLDRNYGFAAAANAGIRVNRSPYVVLLNNDTVPRPQWLGALVDAIEQAPDAVGSIASKMLSMNDPERVDDAGDLLTWQGAAYKRGHGCAAQEYDRPIEVFSACGGAALYRRVFLDDVGHFDERFFAYLEDVDLGLRGQLRGYRCLYAPNAEVLHHGYGSQTRRARYIRLVTRNRLLLLLKNVPAPLLLAHSLDLVYGQFYFVVAYGRPLQSLSGYLLFLRELPHVWRERRAILRNGRIANSDLASRLENGLRDPPLRQLLAQRLQRALS